MNSEDSSAIRCSARSHAGLEDFVRCIACAEPLQTHGCIAVIGDFQRRRQQGIVISRQGPSRSARPAPATQIASRWLAGQPRHAVRRSLRNPGDASAHFERDGSASSRHRTDRSAGVPRDCASTLRHRVHPYPRRLFGEHRCLRAHDVRCARHVAGTAATDLPHAGSLAPLHRAIGYLFFVTAILTTGGGLACIAVRGTIGGWLMDIGFSLRGACPMVTAVVTVRHARRRDRERHRRWALRFFVLAIASWLYRVHHGLWHADGRVVIGEGLFRSFRSDPEFRFLRSLPDRSRDPFRFPTASR